MINNRILLLVPNKFFVVLSLWYMKIFVLSSCYHLCDDMSPYKPIFPTFSTVVMVSRHHLIDDSDLKLTF